MNKRNRIIAVDFDGVIAKYSGWQGVNKYEEPIPGAREFLNELKNNGFYIMIFTQRMSLADKKNFRSEKDRGVAIESLRAYLTAYNLPFDEIWTQNGKPPADAFVDDRAVECRPQFSPTAYNDALNNIHKIMIVGTKKQYDDVPTTV
jgi:histidinol phosphatase-like enzyme